jgi:hypothetical protein
MFSAIVDIVYNPGCQSGLEIGELKKQPSHTIADHGESVIRNRLRREKMKTKSNSPATRVPLLAARLPRRVGH